MEKNKTYGWFKMYWDFLDKLTPESALLLAYLIEVKPIIKKRNGDYFRLSNSFIQERFLSWSNYTIKTKLDELESKGFIDTNEMYEQEHGTKHKTRWVKINSLTEDLINDLNNDLNKDLTEKFNIKENKENKENEENKETYNESSSKEKNFSQEIKQIIDYLNNKANTKYRPTSDNTKKHIIARLNQEYTIDDFKHVIDVKCAEWLNTEMEKFLRPETLFGSKFENYLNTRITASSNKEDNNFLNQSKTPPAEPSTPPQKAEPYRPTKEELDKLYNK